jgi:anti-anti-sigma factor
MIAVGQGRFPVKTSLTQDGSTAILRVEGDLVSHNIPALQATINAIPFEGLTTLHFDLARVGRTDSQGIGTLVATYHECTAHNVEFWIVNVGDSLARALAVCNLNSLLNIVSPAYDERTEKAKRMRKALLESYEYSEQLLASLGEGVVGLDPRGEILFVNHSAEKLLGQSEANLIGTSIFESICIANPEGTLFSPDDHPIQQVLSGKKRIFRGELLFEQGDHKRAETSFDAPFAWPSLPQRESHTTLPAETIATGIFHGPELVGIILGLLDLRECKLAQYAEAQAEKQLRHAQKMEAIGQLSGGVAHDFNNLLQVILGYIDISLEEAPAGSSIAHNLEMIQAAGQRASALTRQLLSFSRRHAMEARPINLNRVFLDLMKMMGRVIAANIKINFIPGTNIGNVLADAGQIEQVLMNLCINAQDAMPQGGCITIQTEDFVVDDSYVRIHSWAQLGRYVLLTVTDSGCGMSEEVREHAFEPFFTTKDAGKGTGLGLATVYAIVKQHSGLLHLYSEVGKGTEFKIYLPVQESPSLPGIPQDMKSYQATPGNPERILLAEDNDIVQKVCLRILDKANYQVMTAKDGQEAYEIFMEHREDIDLILTDVVMPRLGGEELRERVREVDPTLPILFSSGYSENTIHTRFIRDAGLRLIRKPYDSKELLRNVRMVLDASVNRPRFY